MFPVPSIVLTTLNARFAHAAFGLRYLAANLGEFRKDASILEFEASMAPVDVVAKLLEAEPRIIGFGVYVWNVRQLTEVVEILKRLRPQITVIVGGPEVSHEWEAQRIVELADYLITGEADLTFAALIADLLAGRPRPEKVIHSPIPDLASILLPYHEYTEADIAHRIVYVEASRGCPFECEFCLSALDVPVRAFAIERFLGEMDALLFRGVLSFKFVDRTFNLNLRFAEQILSFFLSRLRAGLFLHFEMVPDRLPSGLRSLIAKFPPGTLQFEVGVQTLNDEVSRRISRFQDIAKIEDNLRFLRDGTGVHVHADLVLGLPGESLESIALGFDRLAAMGAQEIQVGLLKRLRGTPIVRHADEFSMRFAPEPPYTILENSTLPFSSVQALSRFSQVWDHVCNRGNFVATAPLFWRDGRSPFWSIMAFSEYLQARYGRTHAISLSKLVEAVFCHLTEQLGLDPQSVAEHVWADYRRGGRTDRPPVLKPFVLEDAIPSRVDRTGGHERQLRHLAPEL